MENKILPQERLITRIVYLFLTSRLSIIIILLAIALGMSALLGMPKEEDPQIIVPMADIFVSAPGTHAEEIHSQISTPLEEILLQIKGVEDVYSISQEGQAIITVKFYVGTDKEDALIRLNTKIQTNLDKVSPLVKSWQVKSLGVEDIPILNIALYSEKYSSFELRQVGQELLTQLSKIEELSNTYLIGGNVFQAKIIFDIQKLSKLDLTPLDLLRILEQTDASLITGKLVENNHEINVEIQGILNTPEDLENLIIPAAGLQPIYLKDIAKIFYGSSDATQYTHISFPNKNLSYNAVTLSFAKKTGTNAVKVANKILAKLDQCQKDLIPDGILTQITRNYGETAGNKVNELLESLFLAILTVIIVLIIFLGWQESMIVAISVPFSFSLALFVDYLFGYSINRVTLFALILSLGLVVDDPITNVENIQRHIRLKSTHLIGSILVAVNEMLPPVIMASLTIIVSFLPLFFITGMMGPYMSPMASTVPLTIIFSTIASLTIVPWMCYKLLNKYSSHHTGSLENKEPYDNVTPAWIRKTYRAIITPFLESKSKRYGLLFGMIVALACSTVMVLLEAVPLQLLPFDNNNVLQLVINLPEDSPLEQTERAVNEFENYLKKTPNIESISSYTGTSSPMDFNGMARHYYLRNSPNLAMIEIQLTKKENRDLSSHEIGLSLRNPLTKIAKIYHANLSIVEMPPGPPVMQSIVAEVTGDSTLSYDQIIESAAHIKKLLQNESFVVDVTDSTEAQRDQLTFVINQQKALLNGVNPTDIIKTLSLALGQVLPLTLHTPKQRDPIKLYFEIPRAERSNFYNLYSISVKGHNNNIIPLSELGTFVKTLHPQPIYQKNLNRIVYVYANTAGAPPSDPILHLQKVLTSNPAPHHVKVNWAGEGSWRITINVFRDMGIGFAAAMLAIYILLFIQTDSFLIPLIMMLSIPLTVIGIVPGFWLLNLIANNPIDGYPTPIFFTATSMIGMIALGGIVIRNSIILISFIDQSRKKGGSFKESILESGAVRLRPIFLTAITAALGAWPITMDPIFSGLAWSLIFGLIASTTFTLIVIPVSYYAIYHEKYEPQKESSK